MALNFYGIFLMLWAHPEPTLQSQLRIQHNSYPVSDDNSAWLIGAGAAFIAWIKFCCNLVSRDCDSELGART